MPLNITEKIIRENALNNTRKRNPGVKFNPGLSANRPSNNWALYRIYNLRAYLQVGVLAVLLYTIDK